MRQDSMMHGSSTHLWTAVIAIALALGASGALAACGFMGSAETHSAGDSGVSADTGGTLADSGGEVDATEAGDSGAGDSRPTGDGACGSTLQTTSPEFQQALTTCVLVQSCDPDQAKSSISNCVTTDYLQCFDQWACLTMITDCAGFKSCTGRSFPTSAQCPAGRTPYCDTNNIAVRCAPDGGGGVTDCSKVGGSCATYVSGGVTLADCIVFYSCSQPTDGTEHCAGNALYTCISGQGFGVNCGLQGAVCDTGYNGTRCYALASNPSSCNTEGSSCQGNVATLCNFNSESGYDCSRAGLQCTPNADGIGTALCIAPDCTYDDTLNCHESCEGSVAEVCAGGARVSFDCSKLAGFTTCEAFHDTTGAVRARCR
jgi:hypothetical protein